MKHLILFPSVRPAVGFGTATLTGVLIDINDVRMWHGICKDYKLASAEEALTVRLGHHRVAGV